MVVLNPNCSEVVFALSNSFPILGRFDTSSLDVYEIRELILALYRIFKAKPEFARVYVSRAGGDPDYVATIISYAYLLAVGEIRELEEEKLEAEIHNWPDYDIIERAKKKGLELYYVDSVYSISRIASEIGVVPEPRKA